MTMIVGTKRGAIIIIGRSDGGDSGGMGGRRCI